MSWSLTALKGQSAAVAAQYMLSGQQNQLASGQQPAGHEVSPDPHCLLLANFMSWAFLATKGQSAAVAAQYMLSGQQNQLASGQQPAGHEVSPDPHCLLLQRLQQLQQRVQVLSNLVEAQLLINHQVPPQLSNLEKLKLTLPILDHQHLHLQNPEDFHLAEVPQPEMTFSNLAEVRQIPTALPHQLLVQQLPQQANQRQRVLSLLGVPPNPNPLLAVP